MIAWISANLGTTLISLALIGVVVIILSVMRNDRKKGKSSCGCSCGNCPMAGNCHTHDIK